MNTVPAAVPAEVTVSPQTGPTATTPRFLLPLVIVLALAVLVAGGLYVYKHAPLMALRGVHVIAVDSTSTALKVFGFTKLEDASFPASGSISSYASAGRVQVAVVGQSVMLAEGKATKTLFTSEGDLAGVAVSSDGKNVAIAEHLKGLDPRLLSSWTVHVIDGSGKELVKTAGYAPHFFTLKGKSYLLVTAPKGITIVDVAAGTSSTESVLDSTSVARTASISPDGAYLAIPDAQPTSYSLYGLTSLTPIRFVPLWTLDTSLVSVAWHNGVLYGVSSGDTPQVRAFHTVGSAAGITLFTLPSNSVSYRITP